MLLPLCVSWTRYWSAVKISLLLMLVYIYRQPEDETQTEKLWHQEPTHRRFRLGIKKPGRGFSVTSSDLLSACKHVNNGRILPPYTPASRSNSNMVKIDPAPLLCQYSIYSPHLNYNHSILPRDPRGHIKAGEVPKPSW